MSCIKWTVGVTAVYFAATVAPLFCFGQQNDDDRPRLRRAASMTGVSQYAVDKWGVVAVEVANPRDTAGEFEVTNYFVSDPSVQYVRRLWVPPNSKRTSWLPIRPSSDHPPDGAKFELISRFADVTNGSTPLPVSRDGRMTESSYIFAESGRFVTKIYSGTNEDLDPLALETVAVARLTAGYPRRAGGLYGRFLPPFKQGLELMDQLVLCSDFAEIDTAGISALRHWIQAGGRLWVMLDLVSPETVSLLLGDAFDTQVVDRVGLTSLQIVSTVTGPQATKGLQLELEEPAEFVRTLPGKVDVTHTIDGWPAAFFQTFGQGEILFTTVSARTWIRERNANDRNNNDPANFSNYVADAPFVDIASRACRIDAPRSLQAEELQPILNEQIGYRIVSRSTVTTAFLAFSGVLLFGGLWLAKRGRLELLGWIGPLAAICTASVVAGLGMLANRGVPSTLAQLQFVNSTPGSDELHVTGLAAIYNNAESSAEIRAKRGGVLIPDLGKLSGTIKKMVWTGMDAWHWEELVLPQGVQTAPFDFSVNSGTPVYARATFGPNGVQGRVSAGKFADFSDAVIATPSRSSLAVHVSPEGEFTAGSADVLAKGQFIADTLLNDEQRRRQEVYRQLVPGPKGTIYPNNPTLLAWSNHIDNGFEFPDQTRQIGSALFEFPLVIERPPAGTRVTIPAPFLAYRTDTTVFSSASYDNRTGEWLDRKNDAQTWLRLQVPVELLPLKLDRASVVVHINGPVKKLVIAGMVNDEIIVLSEIIDPVGTVRSEITQPEGLIVDESGGLRLGVLITVNEQKPSDPEVFEGGINQWKIDYFYAEAQGVITAP